MNHTNRSLDWFLITLVVGISGFGSLIIYTTQLYKQGSDWQQQLIMVVIGSAILLGLSYFPYELLLKFHWFTYGFTNLLLVAVIFLVLLLMGRKVGFILVALIFSPQNLPKLV